MVKNIVVEGTVKFDEKTYKALKLHFGNIPLLIVKTRRGYVASTYIDVSAAEKLGDVACFVSNVKDFSDLHNAKIKHVTSWAEDLGLRPGMTLKKALEILDSE
ncbi:DUF1805 domain-containing protein [Candidatus Micrarchaeota archaeon]|nr:DUF1805 domain-containing protein [Candidatus Micrarchaeota archaeon]